MKRLALLTLAAAAVLAYPAVSGAAIFRGVVIAKQPKRHALVVAAARGAVRTVRTRRARIRVGARIAVRGSILRDGTLSARRIAVRGHARRVHVRAIVVRNITAGRLVAAGHSVFAIRTSRRTAVAGDDNEPQPGDVVDETVDVDQNGDLDEDDVNEVGHADAVELEGRIVSVTPATATDAGSIVITTEHGAQITVTVPAGTTLPQLAVNDRVELNVAVNADKTFTLVKLEREHDGEDGGDDNGGEVQKSEVEGHVVSVTAPTATDLGTLVIETEHGTDVTITVPAGMGLPELKAGDRIEAKVKVDGSTITLLRVEKKDGDGDDDGGGGDH